MKHIVVGLIALLAVLMISTGFEYFLRISETLITPLTTGKALFFLFAGCVAFALCGFILSTKE